MLQDGGTETSVMEILTAAGIAAGLPATFATGDDVWTDHTERLLVTIVTWIAGKS